MKNYLFLAAAVFVLGSVVFSSQSANALSLDPSVTVSGKSAEFLHDTFFDVIELQSTKCERTQKYTGPAKCTLDVEFAKVRKEGFVTVYGPAAEELPEALETVGATPDESGIWCFTETHEDGETRLGCDLEGKLE